MDEGNVVFVYMCMFHLRFWSGGGLGNGCGQQSLQTVGH